MTLEQVSHATGVSASMIHALENDRRAVVLTTAMKLARFYGLPVEEVWKPLRDQVCEAVVTHRLPI